MPALANRGSDSLVRHIERPAVNFSGKPSLADPPVSAIRRIEIFRDAAFRQANELGERRMGAAGSARQRGDKSCDGRAVVPVERAKIDVAGGAAGRTACPQEPIAGRNARADCRRKQHRHPLRLALVPHRDEVVGILENLLFGRTARSRFLLRRLAAPILHFAAVESHAGIVVEWVGVSMSLCPQKRTFGCGAIMVAMGP